MSKTNCLPTVIHLTGTYFPTSQNWVHTQLKYLERWKPIVIANSTANLQSVEWKPDYYSREDHLPYIWRKADGAFRRVFGLHLSHYIAARRQDSEILHAHFGHRGWHALRLSHLLDIPLVTTFYGVDISRLPKQEPEWRHRYDTLFEEGDLFLVEGSNMGEQLEELGCPSRKIRVHHLGIEVDRYPCNPLCKHGDEKLRVLMAGRFVEKKGFIDGLKAFARFLEQGGRGQLTIIGDANDSKSSQSVKSGLLRIVEEREMSGHVEFRGLVPKNELKKAYYRHHVLLSPSREAQSGDNEGGAPVTLIEAQATGTPVISTYHCDIPEVVRDGEAGYLVQERDIPALTKALEDASSPNWIRRAGRRAAEHIRAEYNANKCGKEKDKIYNKLREMGG
ncbi:glycosyltransferase [Salinibacter ruber]|uniref:glycosyltransferase n=1 Tax=Salinibacter ruber TaxID=146919 RepID=UPI0021D44668|nr:glycosyltransferase [Salinibacter ruber]